MLTQLGYAAAILLFAPFGDRNDRRQVIVWKLAALTLALALAGLAHSVLVLALAGLAIGSVLRRRDRDRRARGAVRHPAASIAPSTQQPYRALLGSMVSLARALAPLRRATLAQALLSFAFSAFAVLVSSMFLGMSLGAALASQALSRFGWSGVMLLGTGASLAALFVRYWPKKVEN